MFGTGSTVPGGSGKAGGGSFCFGGESAATAASSGEGLFGGGSQIRFEEKTESQCKATLLEIKTAIGQQVEAEDGRLLEEWASSLQKELQELQGK